MFFNVIHYPVRTEGSVRQRAVYIAISVEMDGGRDICGFWIGESIHAVYSQADIQRRIVHQHSRHEIDLQCANRIENFNRSQRKATKAKAAYPSDTSLLKSLDLAIQDITVKWGRISGWHEMFGQLTLLFGDRIQPGDFA